jgi:hypothetical protein
MPTQGQSGSSERDELRKTTTLIEQAEAEKNEIAALEVSGKLDSASAAKRFEQTQEKIRRHRDETERFERLIARREHDLGECRLALKRARFDVIYEELSAACVRQNTAFGSSSRSRARRGSARVNGRSHKRTLTWRRWRRPRTRCACPSGRRVGAGR